VIAIKGKAAFVSYLTLLVILIGSCNPVLGQTNTDASYLPRLPDEDRLKIREENHRRLNQLSPEDSLSIMLLDIEIEKARVQADQTDFWHRLIPEVRFAASIGVRDVVFIDPSAYVPYVWPTDAYRISGSISLSDLFNTNKHTLANLELQKLRARRLLLLERSRKTTTILAAKKRALQSELSLTEEEIGLLRRLAQYTDLLFQQGETKYDALVRSQLQLLNARKTLERLTIQIQELDDRAAVEGEQ
jgi:hypothetical protein